MCGRAEPQASSSCAETTRLFSPNGANICGHFRAQLHLISYSWSPQQPCPCSWKVNGADTFCALYKHKCISEACLAAGHGFGAVYLLIICSPFSCTRSPQHNFPELPGILTLACLYCLKSRQVMKLRVHWICEKNITSSGSLFSSLIITSHVSNAAQGRDSHQGYNSATATQSRESTHQTTTKTQSTEPLCFFSHCCA